MKNNIPCRKSFTDTLLALAREDRDIVALATDSRGSVTLADFAAELPGQFIECGIAVSMRGCSTVPASSPPLTPRIVAGQRL